MDSFGLKKRTSENKKQRLWTALFSGGLLSYVFLFFVITVAYFLFKPLWEYSGIARATCSSLAVCGVLVIAFCLFWLHQGGRLTHRHLLLALIATGVLFRICYMLYTPFTWRGHDIGDYDSTGHFAYIYNLILGDGLPKSYSYQFYHPPLMHLISAAFCKLCSLFTGAVEPFDLVDPAKVISCLASVSILITSVKIGTYFKLSQKAMLLLTAIMAFMPTFYILAASINNDVLMIALYLAAFYRTLLWKDDPCFKNILMIALCIGGSMMSKLSGGFIALFTAFVFLLVLAKGVQSVSVGSLQKKSLTGLIGQFAGFGLVCVPMGLWYPIRNLILFGQPLMYVPRMSEKSELFCGDMTVWQRFFSFPVEEIVKSPYCHPFGDWNIWVYTLKCSVFGEFQFSDRPDVYSYGLLLFNFLLICFSVAAMVFVWIRRKDLSPWKRFAPGFIWISLMISFIQFNLQYPFGCTMDYRYIVPTCFVGAYYLALAVYENKKKSKPNAFLGWATGIVTAGFCVFSTLFYFG